MIIRKIEHVLKAEKMKEERKRKSQRSSSTKKLESDLGLPEGVLEGDPAPVPECLISDDGSLVSEGFNPRIFTRSGQVATIHNPPPLKDAAVCLARIPRFCGNTLTHWPVLWHLFNAANIAYRMGDYSIIPHMALHDYSESVLGDIPSPFKTKDIKELEKIVISSTFKRYNLKEDKKIWSSIDFIDRLCLVVEAEELLTPKVAKFFGEEFAPSIGMTEVHRTISKPFLKRLISIADNDRKAFDPDGWMVDLYVALIEDIGNGLAPEEAFSSVAYIIEENSKD